MFGSSCQTMLTHGLTLYFGLILHKSKRSPLDVDLENDEDVKLDKCAGEKKKIRLEMNVMYRPLKDLDGIPGAKDLIVCLTGYLRQDREDIMTMVSLMGAQFSKPLVANKVTHLICYKFEGEKYELAKKLATIKLVNHRWLEDCLKNWVLLPEDKYNKSGFELEMMAEEAKDSEDEAEDSKLGQSGGRNRSRSPLGSKFGTAVTHGLSKSLREEASNAIPDSTGPQVFPNADNGKDSSTTTGNKNNSDQDVNLHNIGNLNVSCQVPDVSWHSTLCQLPESYVKTIESKNADFPNSSGFQDLGITVNTNSSGQRPNLRDDTSETKKLSYTGSTSASADVLAHSDGKLGAPSYSRKNQKGFKFSRGLDECDGNNLETPSTKVEKTSEGIKSACVEGSGKETGVIQEDYGNNLLPQKRTNEAASTKSKSRKITANAKLSIERTQPANGKSQGLKVSSVVDEPPVSDGFLSADKDGKNNLDTCLISKSAASATNSVAFDKPVSRNAESSQCNNARQNSAKKAVQSLSKSKISGETDITGFEMGQSDNEAEKFNVTTNLECPSPGKKSKDEGFAGLDNWDLINEESNKLIKKSPRKKSAAKRTLGSRPRKGVTAKLKSPVSLNKTMQQDEGVSSSSRSKEIATSCTKKHQASPEILDVNKLMEQEKVCEYAEDVGGKTDFLDDETEAPDDKCEYELGVAPDEELVHLSKKLDTSAEEKLDAVDHDKKCEAMPPKKVSNKTEKQKLPSLLDSTSKLKVKHQATKRPASKTKKTTVAKKLAKSEEAAVSGEKIPNETKDEAEIKILKEVSVHSDISENSNVPRNKPDSFVEEEKENRPNDREHGLVDRTSVGNQTIKSSVKPANIIKSKKMKHNSSISEFKARAKTEATCFILSGHRFQRKEYQQVIKSLKGRVCRDSHQWSYQATHFIAPDPIRRTEKFFAASASGRWILKTDFLTASSQAGKLLPEEPYEWHKNGLTEDGAINMEAPRKWRLLKERTGHGAFYGMRIVVYGDCFAPPLDTLKRAVKAGDGTILATSPPYTRFLDSGVDYALVSPGMPHVDLWVQEFLKHEIPCVVPDYLVEYVCKPGLSLERHVLYGTHAWADRSFAKLQSKAEEIIEEVIPTKDYNDDDDDDDVACQVCGSQERGDVMLICGDESGSVGCGVGTHIDCCNPPLTVVPEEDWFCPKCSGTQKCSQNPSKRKKGALSSSKKK
ncbi:BRCT domain-containing protein [Trifolium pratense]|uniref:BRCT domain-containing protein n=1 Tax=Trifolium pratense TaxID=57577 RepID=A0A2K3P197_TRIPR|nr:BRCT domain-containing protein [Trifolium pratense]